MSESLSVYTIYENPLDFPNRFVVRRWTIYKGFADPVPDPEPHAVCLTLEAARQSLPEYMYRLSSEADDDRCIVESWI